MSTAAELANRGSREISIRRFDGERFQAGWDSLAVEEPLEIRLAYGQTGARQLKSISVTMRTPGSDAELAAGFLTTEGVIRDATEIVSIAVSGLPEDEARSSVRGRAAGSVATVELAPGVEVTLAALQRNFYTTSSCGVCGKASLAALRSVCPPRAANEFEIGSGLLRALPERLREAQGIFERTGGLHAAGLFDGEGELETMHEDVGRHNALDKLIGAALLEDRLPLRNRLLLLSGRASFELLQKAVMAGLQMVAAVGAPSSLAVEVAREFDVTLAGFLRDGRFNVYHGGARIRSPETA